MSGLPKFIQSARETYLGDYATKTRPAPTEEDIFQLQNEEDTQFEDKFADQVNEVETLVSNLEKETDEVLSNNTKTQLKEKITSLLTKLNTIDERLVLSERSRADLNSYYQRFRQILIAKVRESCEEEVTDDMINAMESFIEMSYAPIKMIVETMVTDPDKIEELFQNIENNTEGYVPSLTKPKSQVIEVPIQDVPDTTHLHMTEQKAPETTPKGGKGKKVSTNDPVMGE